MNKPAIKTYYVQHLVLREMEVKATDVEAAETAFLKSLSNVDRANLISMLVAPSDADPHLLEGAVQDDPGDAWDYIKDNFVPPSAEDEI